MGKQKQVSKSYLLTLLRALLQPRGIYNVVVEGELPSFTRVTIEPIGHNTPSEEDEIDLLVKQQRKKEKKPREGKEKRKTAKAQKSRQPKSPYSLEHFKKRFEQLLEAEEHHELLDGHGGMMILLKDYHQAVSMATGIRTELKKFLDDAGLLETFDFREDVLYKAYDKLGLNYEEFTMTLILFSLKDDEFTALLKLLNIDDNIIQTLIDFRHQYNYLGADVEGSQSPLSPPGK